MSASPQKRLESRMSGKNSGISRKNMRGQRRRKIVFPPAVRGGFQRGNAREQGMARSRVAREPWEVVFDKRKNPEMPVKGNWPEYFPQLHTTGLVGGALMRKIPPASGQLPVGGRPRSGSSRGQNRLVTGTDATLDEGSPADLHGSDLGEGRQRGGGELVRVDRDRPTCVVLLCHGGKG